MNADKALIIRARLAAGCSWDGTDGGLGNQTPPQEPEVRRILRECADRLEAMTSEIEPAPSEQKFIAAREGDIFLPVRWTSPVAVEIANMRPYEHGNVLRSRDGHLHLGETQMLPARRYPDGSIMVLDEL